MNTRNSQVESGFTLIEILVVIGLIAILAAIVIIAINPARQFAQGRNSQRTSNVNSILNAIGQNIADNKGVFNCAAYPLPPSTGRKNIDNGNANIRGCIVPTYMPEIPFDPSAGHYTSATDYDTKYTVETNATGRVKVCAPEAAAEAAVPGPEICVER